MRWGGWAALCHSFWVKNHESILEMSRWGVTGEDARAKDRLPPTGHLKPLGPGCPSERSVTSRRAQNVFIVALNTAVTFPSVSQKDTQRCYMNWWANPRHTHASTHTHSHTNTHTQALTDTGTHTLAHTRTHSLTHSHTCTRQTSVLSVVLVGPSLTVLPALSPCRRAAAALRMSRRRNEYQG